MIIPSIDIRGGQAVQLIGGKEHALDAGDPLAVAERFALAGPLAVIDLDAALGTGDNRAVIEELCRRHRCRVGGGIRSLERALAWLDAGAEQIILGTAATPELLAQLPRERVIAALDAVDGEVVVDGWRTKTGRGVAERMAELRPYVSGFLVTFVEREGRLGGTALDRVDALIEAAGDARVTFAGGVTTADEVATLDARGADAQVGMALYTGRLSLAEALWAPVRGELVPTVIVDEHGVALGLAYSTRESLAAAVASRTGTYWSRSRSALWRKGATSGATQELLAIDLDCDRDALRFTVRQADPGFCHEETRTCWGPSGGLPQLDRTLAARLADAPAGSYTRRLLDDADLLASKLREEVEELLDAESPSDVAHEAADVLYFALVAARRAGVGLEDVARELDRRARRVRRRAGDAKPNVVAPEAKGVAPEASGLRRVPPDAVSEVRAGPLDGTTQREAAALIAAVRAGGEDALRAIAERFGDVAPGAPLVLGRAELSAALDALDPEARGVLKRTATRIRRFATARRADLGDTEVPVPGGAAGVRLAPVERAGCYAPGGRYPLPSSVLMTAITAKVAGVKEVWVASPRPAPATLAAAALAGADGVLAVGGAQAIAALAFGVAVPPCDAIVGPGNRWVTAAKQQLAGTVAIDMLAGPSELVVLADGGADPARIAADLLAQAEHDADAVPMLVATDPGLLDRVDAELARQLASLPTAETARRALAGGFAVAVESLEEAAEVTNRIAPEHLALHVAEPSQIRESLTSYGALFLGEESAEVLGDYGAGPNHVLPTGGTARGFGALDVMTFLRPQGWLDVAPGPETRALARDAAALARMEGLEAHARAADARAADPGAADARATDPPG